MTYREEDILTTKVVAERMRVREIRRIIDNEDDVPGGLNHPDVAEAGVDELGDILGCGSHPTEEFCRSEIRL